ncbi:MAG: hypothetical protein ABH836_08320 [Candidatus Omnitrophota bacterium]
MNERLKEILKKNAEFERKSPYNFCDRWCERCVYEKQVRCKLYQDELEQKITCIAHGREPDDPEITAKVMEKQYEGMKDFADKCEEFEIDSDEDADGYEFEKIKDHIELAPNNALLRTTEEYRKRAALFLKNTLYKDAVKNSELVYDFETIAWYHTLLPVKIQRALNGFYEPVCGEEISLHDAIAQFEICKKAIEESIKALRKIKGFYPSGLPQVTTLLVLLDNVFSRIRIMEENI